MILFLGSNPSTSASSADPFTTDTASGRLLRQWVVGIKGDILFDNISSQKTPDNRPMTKAEISAALASLDQKIDAIKPDKIVALGVAAASALRQLEYEFFQMPHPSGMNRKLNDKQYVEQKLAELRNFCNPVKE